jgi:pyruvate/2-oxoacid:ferredoxin oxidoreductase beta subunit
VGTGHTVACHAVEEAGLDQKKVAVVSGIGCSGRAAGYLRFDSFAESFHRFESPGYLLSLFLADSTMGQIVVGDMFHHHFESSGLSCHVVFAMYRSSVFR